MNNGIFAQGRHKKARYSAGFEQLAIKPDVYS
jgi:hypothetical protein